MHFYWYPLRNNLLNIGKLNQILIVIKLFRLIWYQTKFWILPREQTPLAPPSLQKRTKPKRFLKLRLQCFEIHLKEIETKFHSENFDLV